jgi:hypothetical protein
VAVSGAHAGPASGGTTAAFSTGVAFFQDSPWLPKATNGSFVEANHEKPALSVGRLWRSATGGSGSIAGPHDRPLTGTGFSETASK